MNTPYAHTRTLISITSIPPPGSVLLPLSALNQLVKELKTLRTLAGDRRTADIRFWADGMIRIEMEEKESKGQRIRHGCSLTAEGESQRIRVYPTGLPLSWDY